MVQLRTIDDRTVQLLPDALESIHRRWRGEIITPGSESYDAARSIWNGMIDRRPALIMRCADAVDAQNAVRFAAEHDLLITIRGGGHHIAGNAVVDGGLMIDMSQMRNIQIDPDSHTARVEPGCTLGDFDAAAQAHGLATPLGINSTTGVAGLCLGGGFGWLTRKHGMTIDNLIAVDIITASGDQVRATASEHQDLFWAVRGGGGNFGIVTAFEFQLHPVGPEVLSGLIVHPFENAPSVLSFYRDFVAAAPDDLAVWVVLRKAPPLPFLPPEWHGREVLVLAAFYAGDMARGEKLLAPLRAHGRPIADVVGPHSYAAWQQAFDPLLTPGARNYWKSHDFASLDDGLFRAMIKYGAQLPTDECEIFIGQVGGQMERTAPEATAFANRATKFVMNVHTRWQDAKDDQRCIDWARRFFNVTAPYATGTGYVNFMTEDESDRVAAAYGPNFARLAVVKERYDPRNLFRMNQNIAPAGMRPLAQ